MLNQTIFGLGTHCAAVKKGPSINDVDNWEGGRGQKLVKIADE